VLIMRTAITYQYLPDGLDNVDRNTNHLTLPSSVTKFYWSWARWPVLIVKNCYHLPISPRWTRQCWQKYKPPNTPLLCYKVLLVLGQRTGAHHENCYHLPISPRWTR
jgi:hypothetical protein